MLPPCNEPRPWDWDDRLVWTLRCAIERKLSPGAESRFLQLTAQMTSWSIEERTLASFGVVAGFPGGVRDAVQSATDDLVKLVRGTLTVIASAGEAAVSETTWMQIALVLASPPGADTQKAVDAAMAEIGAEDPEFVEAVVGTCLAIAALRRLAAWASDNPREAIWSVVLLLTNALGELLGDVAADIAAANTPEKIGEVVGDYLGHLVVEVLRMEWGI